MQENDRLNNNISNNNNKNCEGDGSLDNNNLKSKDSPKRTLKTKYNRKELKRLISAPAKSARPLHFSFYCNLCGAGFPSKLSLRTHLTSKHSESTFACSLCPQRFFYESSLNKHLVAKHSSSDSNKSRKPTSTKPADDVEDVAPTQNRAQCPLCSKFLASKVGQHIGVFVHADDCHICIAVHENSRGECPQGAEIRLWRVQVYRNHEG